MFVSVLKVDLEAMTTTTQHRRREGGFSKELVARRNWRTGVEDLPRGIVHTRSDMFLCLLWDSTTKHFKMDVSRTKSYI